MILYQAEALGTNRAAAVAMLLAYLPVVTDEEEVCIYSAKALMCVCVCVCAYACVCGRARHHGPRLLGCYHSY